MTETGKAGQAKLVLLRHGESVWNLENRFTGQVEVELTSKGVNEAIRAGEVLKSYSVNLDCAFTSALRRCTDSLSLVLQSMSAPGTEQIVDPRLNERSYGDLQGLRKSEMIERFGEAQVNRWRRSFSERPPGGESLEDTVARVRQCWVSSIRPRLLPDHHVLVLAHGNSLRALRMIIENLSPEQVMALDIPTGFSFVYEFNQELQPTASFYLGDEKEIAEAIEKVSASGRSNKTWL